MNHLAGESSPYLLQHAGNPVDWYPWGPEAFERARAEDKPIFLSIGYSACHWCHVMERESFTDERTAAFLNEHFVCVKVDREERPDLDSIYMQAVTMLTGRGGWPLSAWLGSDGVPFYGGTYFPPLPRFGMPSFLQVLEALVDVWKHRRDELREAAVRMRKDLADEGFALGITAPRPQVLIEAGANLRASFDPVNGGWGGAPKFPQPLVLEFLLAQAAESTEPQLPRGVESTLDAMAGGGIYDQLGGGFHRYSTDEIWLVPHFEKMLYDNAQLARCYLHAWQISGKPRYREVAEETLDYLLRRMGHPDGGFFSAEDADSEGKEGAFYVWTLDQIRQVLPAAEANQVAQRYGVSAQGDFDGASILHMTSTAKDDVASADATLAAARARLLQAREQREPPARDEKVLAGWNGLALGAFAEAARALSSERYREAAAKTGTFIVGQLMGSKGHLAHMWKDGHASGNGFLDDYAAVAEGLLALYQTTFDELWFTAARDLVDTMIENFRREGGGFYDTDSHHEALVVRPRALQDSPTPCGNSSAATVLLKIAAYSGEARYWSLAEETLRSGPAAIPRAPVMFGQWLFADLLAETGLTEVAVIGDLNDPHATDLLSIVQLPFRPALVLAARSPGAASVVAMLQEREPGPEPKAAAWVCRRSTCSAPTSDPERLRALLTRIP